MRFLFLLILYPRKTTSQCVSMQDENLSIDPVLKNVSALECITFTLINPAKPEVYWDARERVCSNRISSSTHASSVIAFTFILCEKVTESHCMHVTEGREDTARMVEGGDIAIGPIPIPMSECQELCRAVTTCDTATWTDNACTINSKYGQGKGIKVILKDPNCKGRRSTVIRLFRHVRGADRENNVSDISECMRLQGKRRCSLVDFDNNDQSCWCQRGGKGKGIHGHNSAVQFVPQADFQNQGEVTYTEPESGSMECGYMVPGKVLERSCRSLCSGLANCIAYSHNGVRQECHIHLFACRRNDLDGFSLKLVDFNNMLHHDSYRFSCFTTTERTPPLMDMPGELHVVSTTACAVACSQQKSCLGFTYNKINHKCATSLKPMETYEIRAC